jgi:HNH endonuclease
MTIEQIESAVKAAGLSWKTCSPSHWQVIGGIAVVNVHRGKSGYTIYVQGMGKGRKANSPKDVVESAKQLQSIGKVTERKRCRGTKKRKWNQAVNRGEVPRCHWCGTEFGGKHEATGDHVIPLSRGGSNGDDNIVLACKLCNEKRKNNVTSQEIASVNQQNN